MPRKSKKPVRKQTHSPTGKVVGQVGQILLPMIAGIAATKADLTEWVYEQGLTALHLLLREDAEKIAGPKGKHEKERTHNHWGSTDGELSFGGRRIQVSRPRVRSKSGEDASLPHFEAFREEDPLPERVLNQILVGVSTRNYESSLDKPSAKLKSRGTSKSAASRHLVSQTTKKLEEYLSRRLEEFELAALMMDGLEVAGQTVVVTLGITIDGTKVPLGIWVVLKFDQLSCLFFRRAQHPNDFFDIPHAIRHACSHSWRNPKRPVNSGEVVVHIVERDGSRMVFNFLGESIGQPRKAPHAHSHREVLTLYKASRNMLRIRVSRHHSHP